MLLVRWLATLAGLAAVLGAMVSLTLPLTLHVVDRRGEPIVCGTGWRGDPATAQQEDMFNRQQHLLVGEQFVISNYAGECDRRVVDRRHLAAGVAGFIKTVLSVRHGVIPKHLHFSALTPHAGVGASKFTIAAQELAWPAVDRARRAGVSSFGVSGTNAHVVVEQAPEAEGRRCC